MDDPINSRIPYQGCILAVENPLLMKSEGCQRLHFSIPHECHANKAVFQIASSSCDWKEMGWVENLKDLARIPDEICNAGKVNNTQIILAF